MENLNRDDLYLLNKHSNINEAELNFALQSNVYNTPTHWQAFIKWFLLSIGVGFGVAGIVFFFAYNWDDMHKFVKMGIIQSLIVVPVLIVLFSKLNATVKNIILTAASIMVGVLFAVFGQIYQTGADAYDFFLGWTLSIVLWVIISGFAPLWLVFLILINTTLSLYYSQVVSRWNEAEFYIIRFLVNAAFFFGVIIIKLIKENKSVPNWFLGIVTVATFFYVTFAVCISMFSDYHWLMLLLIFGAIALFAIAAYISFKEKNIFNLSLIAISLIVIGVAFLIKISYDSAMLLFITAYVIGGITLSVKLLIELNKKWINEK